MLSDLTHSGDAVSQWHHSGDVIRPWPGYPISYFGFCYIQSATPPAPPRHRRVWEKGLRGLPDSPRQDRNKRASSGAVRLQSPISSSVCGRRTRCKHLLSWDLSREIKHFSPGLLKIVRLVLFFKKKSEDTNSQEILKTKYVTNAEDVNIIWETSISWSKILKMWEVVKELCLS